MERNSEEISPTKIVEFKTMIEGKRQIANKCNELKPGFAVLFYGSCVYGRNPQYYREGLGSYEDIDGMLVVPDGFELSEFSRQLSEIINIDNPLSISDLDHSLTGNNRLRISGAAPNGKPVSFHVMTKSALTSATHPASVGTDFPIKVPNVDKYRSKQFKLQQVGKNKETTQPAQYQVLDSDWLILHEQSTTRVENQLHIGVVGDKLLVSEVVYDPGIGADENIQQFWENLIRYNLFLKPNSTNEEIIAGLLRSRRFSKEFEVLLDLKINTERRRYLEQMARTFPWFDPMPHNVGPYSQVLTTNSDCRVTETTIYKSRGQNISQAKQEVDFYEGLKNLGINVGEHPEFMVDEKLGLTEKTKRYPGETIAEKLIDADKETALALLQEMATDVKKVISSADNNGRLSISFDPIPQNYVFDGQSWRYIDYHPVATKLFLPENHKLLDPNTLVKYFFVKFARYKPEFLPEIASKLSQEFSTYISDYLDKMMSLENDINRIYSSASAATTSEDRLAHIIVMLHLTNTKGSVPVVDQTYNLIRGTNTEYLDWIKDQLSKLN